MTSSLTNPISQPIEIVEGMNDEVAEELVLIAADLERELEGDGAAEHLAHALAPLPSPEMGVGHELLLDGPEAAYSVMRSTLDKPNFVSANASRTRLSLSEKTGSLTMALDLADTIGAQNSAEQMLAHQMAAAHSSVMHLMARAQEMTRNVYVSSDEAVNVRATRLMGTAAKLMNSYQQGLQTLHRLRTGGKQEVRVIHQQVQVNEGGQAVVAGNIGGGLQRRKRRGTGGESER